MMGVAVSRKIAGETDVEEGWAAGNSGGGGAKG